MRFNTLSTGIVTATLFLACAPLVRADTINFDDLVNNGRQTPIPNGYHGFNWNNFDVLNPSLFGQPSGYDNAVVSPPNVATTGFADPPDASFSSPTAFTFVSADLTAAWYEGLDVRVYGLLGGKQVDFQRVFVDTSGPTLATFNWIGVDTIEFKPIGGMHENPTYGVGTEQVAIDNVVIAPVPEGSAFLMLLGGAAPIGVFAAYRRLRNKR